jgi:hypothetical protein
MKTSIVYLGIAMVVLTSTKAAAGFSKVAKSNTITVVANVDQGDSYISNSETHKIDAPVEDQTVINPELVLNRTYQSAIEDVIAENNKIIESDLATETVSLNLEKPIEEIIQENNQIIGSETATEIRPLTIERSIEEVIAEDNAIIESTISTKAQPLNFELINKNSLPVFKPTNTKLVGMF